MPPKKATSTASDSSSVMLNQSQVTTLRAAMLSVDAFKPDWTTANKITGRKNTRRDFVDLIKKFDLTLQEGRFADLNDTATLTAPRRVPLVIGLKDTQLAGKAIQDTKNAMVDSKVDGKSAAAVAEKLATVKKSASLAGKKRELAETADITDKTDETSIKEESNSSDGDEENDEESGDTELSDLEN